MVLFNIPPIKHSRLQVQTDLNALTEVLQWYEQFNQPPLSYDLWWQSKVALDEGFTNAVLHAHLHLPPTTPIEIEVIVFADYLEMRIFDQGQPFNLAEKLQTLRHQNLNPLEKEGGRGLIFMQHLCDELDYLRLSNQQNCLVMRKKISS